MNLLQEYVAQLTDEQRKQIIADFELLERDGVIGDAAIRFHAKRVLPNINPVMSMTFLGNECYRYYGKLYLND